MPDVVGVEKGDQVPFGLGQSLVPGRRYAAIRLPDIPHRRAELGQLAPGVVGGTVVDEQDLERRDCLRERASDSLLGEGRTVVRRDDYALEPGMFGRT